jgi:serine O-acetyltransferase
MLNSLTFLLEDLREKARWNYGGDGLAELLQVLGTDGTLAMVLYRLMQGSRAAGLAPLEVLFSKLNSAFGNAVIGRGAEFGPGFVLFHSNGVVINTAVRGGSNVRLHHEVTIGSDEAGRNPVLGSNIDVGAGAKIIGGVTIGDGARVGANAVVVHDVPAGATVVGVPAKQVRQRSAEEAAAPPPRMARA